MNAYQLTLNIAVNLGRLARWVSENKTARVSLFLTETDSYLHQLEEVPKSQKFNRTFQIFKKNFIKLKNSQKLDETWAEEVLTWANILTHRAKLA